MKGYKCEFSCVGRLEVTYVVSEFTSLSCNNYIY